MGHAKYYSFEKYGINYLTCYVGDYLVVSRGVEKTQQGFTNL